MAKQLVVLIENRPGSLADITSLLAEAGINIEAVMIEGNLDFGTLRLHVSNAKKADKVLRDAGYQVVAGDVLVLDLPNEPGALAEVCEKLGKAKINIECLFGTTGSREGRAAELVLKVSDVEKAKSVLKL